MVSLAVIYEIWRSTPHDEMLYLNISASISTLMKYEFKASFSYNFALLTLRSLNEFPRIKNTERAIDQLEKLNVAYNNRDNKLIYNIHSTPYETHLAFVLLLADKFIEMGLSITAVSLYEQAGLYEECIEGLIKKDFKEKALELINKLIEEKGKNPRLLCMFGDIYPNEPKYYE